MQTRKIELHLMTEGNIWKQILLFSVPLVLGNLLQELYNTVDSVIVGNYVGSHGLAAVSAGTALINLFIAFSQGSAVGAGVLIAQYLGAEDEKATHSAVHTSLAVSVVLGAVLSILAFLFGGKILIWMKTPESVLGEASIYLRIYGIGILFNIIYNMAAGIINAAGNAKKSLEYLGVASVLNIILDLVLIVGAGMGAAGAAVATTISQLVSCVLALGYLMQSREIYRVEIRKIRIQKGMLFRIIALGLPTGIQNMLTSFSNVIVQSGVNGFGAGAMAGFGAYMKIDGFNIMPIRSFTMAITTFAGQNYGAGKGERVKKGMWITLAIGAIYTVITAVLLLTFSREMIGLFTKEPEVIRYGVLVMRYLCPFYAILSVMHILAGVARGLGKTLPPMLILITAMCVLRVFWVQLIQPYWHSMDTLCMVYPISWILGMVMMGVYTWLNLNGMLENIAGE